MLTYAYMQHTYVLTHRHMLAHIHAYTYTHTYIHTRTCMLTQTHILTYTHTCLHATHIRTYTHTHAYAHTYTHTHTQRLVFRACLKLSVVSFGCLALQGVSVSVGPLSPQHLQSTEYTGPLGSRENMHGPLTRSSGSVQALEASARERAQSSDLLPLGWKG